MLLYSPITGQNSHSSSPVPAGRGEVPMYLPMASPGFLVCAPHRPAAKAVQDPHYSTALFCPIFLVGLSSVDDTNMCIRALNSDSVGLLPGYFDQVLHPLQFIFLCGGERGGKDTDSPNWMIRTLGALPCINDDLSVSLPHLKISFFSLELAVFLEQYCVIP